MMVEVAQKKNAFVFYPWNLLVPVDLMSSRYNVLNAVSDEEYTS